MRLPPPPEDLRPPGTLELLWFWRRGIARVALTMIVVGVGYYAALTLIEIPLAPWIRSFGLWPTLTGDWHGEVLTADGRVSFVYFEIRGEVLNPSSRGTGRSYIRGTARWCDESRRIWDYDVWGNPDNWRGTKFHLSTSRKAERESGVTLGDLRGEWRGDEIRALGALVAFGRSATATASRSSPPAAPPPPVRYTLRRGAEKDFLAACGTKG